MQPGWRYKRNVTILSDRIVRGDKPGKHNDGVQQREKRYGGPHFPLASHLLITSYCILTRGSAATSMTSASRFPTIMKRVDDITAPTTTYKSLDMVASSNNGPNPGQPVTTSTSSDPLRSPPTE